MNARPRIFTSQPTPAGYQIHLNNTPFPTPAGKAFIVPTKALANTLVHELTTTKNITLPLQLTYTALDQDLQNLIPECLNCLSHDAILFWKRDTDDQANFFESNLKPVLRVIAEKSNVVLAPTHDLTPPVIPAPLITKATDELQSLPPFSQVAFREICTALGSYLLSFLLTQKAIDTKEAIRLSLIEQHFQRERWGTTDTHEEAEEELTAVVESCISYMGLVGEE